MRVNFGAVCVGTAAPGCPAERAQLARASLLLVPPWHRPRRRPFGPRLREQGFARARHATDPTPQTPSESTLPPPESTPRKPARANPAADIPVLPAPLRAPFPLPETAADPTHFRRDPQSLRCRQTLPKRSLQPQQSRHCIRRSPAQSALHRQPLLDLKRRPGPWLAVPSLRARQCESRYSTRRVARADRHTESQSPSRAPRSPELYHAARSSGTRSAAHETHPPAPRRCAAQD